MKAIIFANDLAKGMTGTEALLETHKGEIDTLEDVGVGSR